MTLRRLVILALLLRLGLFLAWHGGALTGPELLEPLGDQEEYVGLADSLRQGKGFVLPYVSSVPAGQPYIFRPPLYPLFLAAARALGDAGFVRGLQLLLTALFVPLAWRLAGLLGASRGLAGLLAATNPFLIYFATTLQSDWLFQLLLAAALVAWTAWVRGEARAAPVGIWFALAALTRGEAWYMAWALGLASLVGVRRRDLGLMLLGFLLPILPWTVRNYCHYHAVIPVQAGILSLNLVLANGPPWTRTEWPGYPEWRDQVLAHRSTLPLAEQEGYLLGEVRTWFWAHRGAFLRSCGEKLARFGGTPHQGDDGTGQATPYQGRGPLVVGLLGFTLLIPFMLFGAAQLRAPLSGGYLAIWLVNLGAFVLTNPSLRVRSQLQLLYLVLVALGLTRAWTSPARVARKSADST